MGVRKKIIIILLVIATLMMAGGTLYLGDYYRGDVDAIGAFVVENPVEMQVAK